MRNVCVSFSWGSWQGRQERTGWEPHLPDFRNSDPTGSARRIVMSEFFRQFSDDQLALMLCGFAILGCWCLLQISYYVGKAGQSSAVAARAIDNQAPASVQEKAA